MPMGPVCAMNATSLLAFHDYQRGDAAKSQYVM